MVAGLPRWGTQEGIPPVGAPPEQPPQPLSTKPLPDVDPDDVPTLTGFALWDPDPQRRDIAVTLLGASADPQVIPVLAQALKDQDEDVRMAALQSLSDFPGQAPFDAIGSVLNDPSAEIRYEALKVLSDLDSERARQFLQRGLTDPDEAVRALAKGLLEMDETASTVPIVTPPAVGPAERAGR